MFIRVSVCLGMLAAAVQPSDGQQQVSLVSLHFVAEEGLPGVEFRDRDTGERLVLRAEPTLETRHMASVHVARDTAYGEYQVRVTLSPEGQRRLEQDSGEFLGQKIAIVVDGEVVYTAIVGTRLKGASPIPILITESEEEARNLEARLDTLLRE